jgi:L-lactate dehydrogenase complex protein LldF
MALSLSEKFLIEAEKKAFDLKHRKTINYNIGKYDSAVIKGKQQYYDLNLAKERASIIKNKCILNLEKYLTEFEANFVKRGGKVIWAQDENEAIKEIIAIAKKYDAKIIVKSKSMVTEEIHLNQHLEKHKYKVIETDLGEFIQQIDGEPPYHIVTPAMHKSKEDISKLFHKKFSLSENLSPQEITLYVREKLKKDYTEATIGITGANFIIADTGSVAITENEGNAFMVMSFPKVHIAIVGIEKVISSIKDLDLFWPLLASHGTGQNLTVYNSIISGPKSNDDTNGPEDFYVILLDNGRTNLLSKQEKRSALNCIRCGACLNACPIYKNIGGHTYSATYSGPIGSVITPHLKEFNEYKHLSYASSLCGKCSEVCPVKIPIHNFLLYNRKEAVEKNTISKKESWIMYFYKKLMLKRSNIEKGGSILKNLMLNQFFKSSWGNRRELPLIANKSFNQIWRDYKGIK